MKKDFIDYTWGLDVMQYSQYVEYSNVFTDSQIEEIKQLGDGLEGKVAEIGLKENGYRVHKETRDSIISFIPASAENQWLFRTLTDVIMAANKTFFRFDINSIEVLQYTNYYEGGFYRQHIDITSNAGSTGIRKLSFSLQLTDEEDYVGGNLIILNSKEGVAVSRKKGSITFFPSYTPHEVLPVTRGVRKALVGWVMGPNFK